MSTHLLAGAAALVALLYAPTPAMVTADANNRAAGITHVIPASSKTGQGAHCQSTFGPAGSGWSAHRHWRACAGAGGEDHPYISQHLRNQPNIYLDVSRDDEGPHDDF